MATRRDLRRATTALMFATVLTLAAACASSSRVPTPDARDSYLPGRAVESYLPGSGGASDQPVVVTRTMTWDDREYGAHAETAVAAPSTTWYLAEGSTAGDFALFYLLQKRGHAARVASDIEVFRAKVRPPQTTRAKLRGDFIRAAQARGRDFTVDWVHLKLNDQAQRTVLCKDPFRAVDERVERLMDTISRSPAVPRSL